MTYLNLFLISLIWVIILDLSGFMDEFKTLIAKFIHIPVKNIQIKPFECSLCMTWWSGLIYLLIIHEVSFLTISAALFFAFLTTTTKDALYLIQDFLNWVIRKFSKLLQG